MLQLRTAAFFIGWIAVTAGIGILGIPTLLSQKLTWRMASLWVCFTLLWLRITCGVRSEVQGQPASQLVACKHQSAWDTLMMWRIFGNPVFVLKRELYWIPVFGWYLWRTGQIGINRSDGRSAYEQIEKQAGRVLAQGRSIVMFPEGTRVRIGDKKPYRSGIARVSALLQLPVTPAALNAGLFWPKVSLLKRPGRAVLKFLAPVPVCGNDPVQWMQQLETRIESETQQLLAAGAK
jgi:1-acyl-sn-glycerol-3-phosphate acyltransferase